MGTNALSKIASALILSATISSPSWAEMAPAQSVASSLKVGAILPLTGPGTYYGEELRRGMELCRSASSPQVVFEDSQTKPAVAVSALNKLIYSDQIDLAVSAFSPISKALIPIARQKNLPLLITVVSSSKVAREGGANVIRYFTSGEQEGPLQAEFAYHGLHVRNAAVLHLDDEYGQSFRDAFSAAFIKLGGVMNESISFLRDDTDFRPLILRLKSKDPGLVLIIGLEEHVGIILKQAQELGLKASLMSNWSSLSLDSIKAKGFLYEGLYTLVPEFYMSRGAPISAFKDRFRAQYHKDASPIAGLGCDIISMLGQPGMTRDTVLGILRTSRDFPGIMGKVQVDSSGDITFPVFPTKIQDSKFVLMPR